MRLGPDGPTDGDVSESIAEFEPIPEAPRVVGVASALAWLTEDLGPQSRCATDELTTTRLRAEIVARARAHQLDACVIENYRGPGVAVPLVIVLRGATIGIWAYAGLTNLRTISTRAARLALDYCVVVATRGSADLLYVREGSETSEREIASATYADVFRARLDSGVAVSEGGPKIRIDAKVSSRPSEEATVKTVARFVKSALSERLIAARSVEEARDELRVALRRYAENVPGLRLDESGIRTALKAHIASVRVGAGHLISELKLRGSVGSVEDDGSEGEASDDEVDPDDDVSPSHSAVADEVFAAPDGLHIWEIKGATDTFVRLQWQMAVYERISTTATIVVPEVHLARALKAVPDWWGILVAELADGRVSIREVREAQRNEKRDREFLFGQLLADEIKALAKTLGFRRISQTWVAAQRTLSILNDEQVAYIVGHALSHRTPFTRVSDWKALHAEVGWPEPPALPQLTLLDPMKEASAPLPLLTLMAAPEPPVAEGLPEAGPPEGLSGSAT